MRARPPKHAGMNANELLEDTFGDCLRKAMRGNKVDSRQLAASTGLDAGDIDRWLADDGTADASQARTLARALHLNEDKFVERAAGTWAPPPIHLDSVRRHSQHPHPSNGYVLVPGDGKRAALVDPAGDPKHLLGVLRDGGYDLQYILITHKHDDHCDAAADVAKAFPNAKVVMHELDIAAIGALGRDATRVRDGESLPFGDDGGQIHMLHTPGHTDGSACFLFEKTLFTGDTMFAGSIGGAYGDKSTYGDILESVGEKLFTLPEDTVVMPGHGPPTTIGLERQHDPFL
jgi:hydroxyacylglutathione hydrolase